MPKFKSKNVQYALVTFHVTHCDPCWHDDESGELVGSSNTIKLHKFYPYLKNKDGNFRRTGNFVYPDHLNPCHYGMSFAFENATPDAHTRINSDEQIAYIKSYLPTSLWQLEAGKGFLHIDNLFPSIRKAGIDLHFKNSYPKISRKPILVKWNQIYDAVKPDDPYWNCLARKRFDFLSREAQCMEDSDED